MPSVALVRDHRAAGALRPAASRLVIPYHRFCLPKNELTMGRELASGPLMAALDAFFQAPFPKCNRKPAELNYTAFSRFGIWEGGLDPEADIQPTFAIPEPAARSY